MGAAAHEVSPTTLDTHLKTRPAGRSRDPLALEWISHRERLIDDLAVLQIFREERGASRLQRCGHDQGVVKRKPVPLGHSQSTLVKLLPHLDTCMVSTQQLIYKNCCISPNFTIALEVDAATSAYEKGLSGRVASGH